MPAGPQNEEHHDRPDHVELLFDGERPEVTQWREIVDGRVTRADPDLEPVRSVEHTGHHVAAKSTERVALEERRPHDEQTHHDEESRQKSSGATAPESPQIDGIVTFVFGDEEQCDEVAADHEEDLDTEETAGQP